MKFNYKGQVEGEKTEGGIMVTNGTRMCPRGILLNLAELKQDFTPADCEALNLVDPDRVKRLSK